MYFLLFLIAFAANSVEDSSHTPQWSRFRGPNGEGVAAAQGIPSEWGEENTLWKKELPGVGHSSPIVWDDHLYVTAGDPESGEQQVFCFDAKSGAEIWDKRIPAGTHRKHEDNSFATSTPAADADRLYVMWYDGAKVHMAALTHSGEEVWQREVATIDEKHGYGTSPIVVGGVVCFSNETEDPSESKMIGLEATTGKTLWEVPRGAGKTAFATPCLWNDENGNEYLLAASMGSGLTAYEPATGKIAWQTLQQELPDRCVSSLVVASGLVLASCGSGNNGMHMIAVKPTAEGGKPEEIYRIKSGVPNIPTPIVFEDLVFLWHDRGTVSCIDGATGEVHWRERIGGYYHSSPVRIGDRIFGLSRDGEMVVLAASKDYKLLGRNDLHEPSQATPAVAHDRMYVRTESTLYAIGSSP